MRGQKRHCGGCIQGHTNGEYGLRGVQVVSIQVNREAQMAKAGDRSYPGLPAIQANSCSIIHGC